MTFYRCQNKSDDWCDTVIDIFHMHAQRMPNTIALSDDQSELTYQRLDEKTNQIAQWLQQQDVKPGDFVAILLAPSIDFIVCILAIVKSGAVYIPLDRLAPQKRLAEILEDAAPKLMITDGAFLLPGDSCPTFLMASVERAVLAYSTKKVKGKLSPISPLYMMYTSGSTGTPKGVMVPHRAVVNLVAVDNYAKVHEGGRVAQFSNLAFDASTFEIWSALLNGSTLVIASQNVRSDLFKLKPFVEQHAIEYLFLPTSLFHQLIKSAIDVLNHVKVIIFGGEQVNIKLLKTYIQYRQKNTLPVTLINGYGPTEATTFTCRRLYDENFFLNDDEFASIGQAIDNVKTYILDENYQICLEGELYISGVNLALGYHNCHHQNEAKFIQNPFCKDDPFQRLYKTGDKVKTLPSGNLLYLGRLDDQVKIGGFRIHLNEVENQLMKHPDISLTAVTVELGGGAHQLLTAYLVSSSRDQKIDAGVLWHFLSESLPPYMVPSKYCLVEQLPLTPVGKVDKSRLHTIPHLDLSLHSDISSLSQIEEQIKRIWMHLLNRQTVDINKNLFEMGVNSLLMAEACTRINEALQSTLQVSTLITYPTIHRLSRYLEGDIEEEEKITHRKQVASLDIAIIGMSCRFPKASAIQAFWDNLCQGEDGLTRFTDDELMQAGRQNKLKHENFVPVKGVLSDIDQFDASFFGFNPVDASMLDPQQRIFLECAWEALEHAGVAPSKIGSKTISVFAGMADSTYLHENLLKNNWVYQEQDRFQQRIASSMGMLSTQVSYRLNLKGRSLNINTACSTGLVTVAAACQELINGNSDVALAGAVSIVVPQIDGYIYQQGSIESSDGVCRPFDSRANGTVFSNGVGVVILKRLTDAINDNDTIYAVIKGTGVNNDGADKLGYTAPSIHGQKSCIREALNQAVIQADDIGYVEAHGTATALGDVVEMEALSAVYREQSEKEQFCALGSVKGNIGHTDVAAGIAGLIKTALCLYYQKIPPTLHFEHPHPDICFATSPFFINQHLIDWKVSEKKRYAGVSSFGVGGTNVHLILSEHNQLDDEISKRQEHLFILSAKSEAALMKNREHLVNFISAQQRSSYLANVAYTLQTGREDFEWRCFAVGSTAAKIKNNLLSSHMQHSETPTAQNVIFMFPGQGMQYHHMATSLLEASPYFAALVHQGVSIAKAHLDVDLLEILHDEFDERLNQTQYTQPLLFIIEYALAQLLMHDGIKPNGLIGHSLGEYVAACVAGVFSYEDGVTLVCQRGLLMASAPRGAMLAVACSVEELALYQQDTELALHNAINHCVISGEVSSIVSLEKKLLKAGKTYKKLKVSHAFHSRLMESIGQPFKALFDKIQLSAPTIAMISNVTGKWLSTQEITDPAYWYKHLRHTVQFCKGLETILDDQRPILIEVGPGQSLSVFLKEVATQKEKQVEVVQLLPTHHNQQNDLEQFLNALGALWQLGIHIQWSAVYEGERRAHVPLPTYAFQKQRYWIEPDKEQYIHEEKQPKMYKPVWSHQPTYLASIALSKTLLAQHEWIIIKDQLGMSDSLIARLEQEAIRPIIITFDKTYRARDDAYFAINPEKKAHYVEVLRAIQRRLTQPIVLHCGSYASMDDELISSKAIDRHLMTGFYSLLYFTQAYLEVIGEQCPLRVGVITTGTQQVLGTEAIYPIHATVVGPCRVIPQEHALLKFKLMDLNPMEAPQQNEKLINKILDTCLKDTWDKSSLIKAYRNGHEWSVMYGRANASHQVTHRLHDNGVYLFTGGTGGIALSCCEAIAKTVSSPIFILLSRSTFPEETTWNVVLQDQAHRFYDKVLRIFMIKFYAFDR